MYSDISNNIFLLTCKSLEHGYDKMSVVVTSAGGFSQENNVMFLYHIYIYTYKERNGRRSSRVPEGVKPRRCNEKNPREESPRASHILGLAFLPFISSFLWLHFGTSGFVHLVLPGTCLPTGSRQTPGHFFHPVPIEVSKNKLKLKYKMLNSTIKNISH